MEIRNTAYSLLCIILFLFVNCRQVYNPPAIPGNNKFLIVDGIIRNGIDSTIIKLSRSANLGDSSGPQPELNAQVTVVGQSSGNFPLINMGNGQYTIDQLNLDITENYQLRITSSNGNQYASDFVPIRQSPPIDSVHWQTDSTGVTIYVNAHDPQNNTRYYQWDFTQTWEHRVPIFSGIYFLPDGTLANRTADQQVFRCWTINKSTDILVASTLGLSQDVVYENPILVINDTSEQISFLYSILVRQYAITQKAYEFWQNLKKNTELTGTIFDAQPSDVPGNIHCLTKPNEPVLGFVSISSESSQRIFIERSQILFWNYIQEVPDSNCLQFKVAGPNQYAFYANLQNVYTPYYKCIGRFCFVAITHVQCADCRSWGGTNVHPGYWPD